MVITLEQNNSKMTQYKIKSANKQSKLKSQSDKYADLLHLYDIEGKRFFTQEDVKEVEHQIYGEQLSQIKNWEKYEKNFNYQTQTPETIIDQHLNQDYVHASQYFEGLTTKVYHYKKQDKLSCQKLVEKLNQNNQNRVFDFFKQKNNEYYVIEKTKLFLDFIPQIFECLQQLYQSILSNVAYQYNLTEEQLSNCIFKQKKNELESLAINDLIKQNGLLQQKKILREKGFNEIQIKNYFNLTEQQLQKQLQYYYDLQKEQQTLEKQTQKIEQLKKVDKQNEENENKNKEIILNQQQTDKDIIFQLKQDLRTQKYFFQKKMNKFLRKQERQNIDDDPQALKRQRIQKEDEDQDRDDIEANETLFSKEIQELFMRRDDEDQESTFADEYFDGELTDLQKEDLLRGLELEQTDNFKINTNQRAYEVKKARQKKLDLKYATMSQLKVANDDTKQRDIVEQQEELNEFKNS